MNDFLAIVGLAAGVGLGVYALNQIVEGGRVNPTRYTNAISAVDCKKLFKSQVGQCLCSGFVIGSSGQIQNNQISGRR